MILLGVVSTHGNSVKYIQVLAVTLFGAIMFRTKNCRINVGSERLPDNEIGFRIDKVKGINEQSDKVKKFLSALLYLTVYLHIEFIEI